MQKIKNAINELFEQLDPNKEIIPAEITKQIMQDLDDAQAEIVKQAEQDAEVKVATQQVQNNGEPSTVEKIQQEFEQQIKDKEEEIQKITQEFQQQLDDAKNKACAAVDQLKQQHQQELDDAISQQQQQNADDLIKVQQQQQSDDDKIAMLKTQELIDGLKQQQQQQISELENDINEHLNTFLDSKAILNMNINAVAENKNYKNVIGQIRDLLFEAEVFNKTIDDKAAEINDADKKNANEAIAKSIELQKANESLEKANDVLAAKLLLSEKTHILPTRVAELVSERLEGMSKDEIESEFDSIVESVEEELESMKASKRSQYRKSSRFDNSLNEELEKKQPKKPSKTNLDEGEMWANVMNK